MICLSVFHLDDPTFQEYTFELPLAQWKRLAKEVPGLAAVPYKTEWDLSACQKWLKCAEQALEELQYAYVPRFPPDEETQRLEDCRSLVDLLYKVVEGGEDWFLLLCLL